MIYAGVAQCPYCREWTVGGPARRSGRRRVGWAIAVALAALAATALILRMIL